MGQTLSKYMMERTEKARSKRRLIKHLEELREYIELLQKEREELENQIFEYCQTTQPPRLKSDQLGRAYLDECKTTEVDEERQALERKISIQEFALDITNTTCESLNKDVSRLLKRKSDLERENSSEETRLAELKQQLEADQFLQLQKEHPLDTWTSRSLPNLHFTDILQL